MIQEKKNLDNLVITFENNSQKEMSQGTSGQKSYTPKRKPRQEKLSKDFKPEKESEKIKPSPISRRENIKLEKYRSGSLNRQNSIKIQESPRKSQSVDRNQSTKVKTSDFTTSKVSQGSTLKLSGSTSREKGGVSNSRMVTSKLESKTSRNISNKKNVSTPQKKIRSEKSLKATDAKTNVQIAKSFIKNANSKSNKPVKAVVAQISTSKKQSLAGPDHKTETHSVERPRTSTILKRSSEAERSLNETNYEKKGTNLLNTDRPLSRSKSNLKGESDDDKASYEEDFEEYDSDFEESDSESSITESDNTSTYSTEEQEEIIQDCSVKENITVKNMSLSIESMSNSNHIKIQAAPEKTNVEKRYLKMSDRSSLYTEKTIKDLPEKKTIKLSRSFINFQSAIKKEESIGNDPHLHDLPNELKKFDDASLDELDVPPLNYTYSDVNKYNLKQVFVQTEQCHDEEVQTDEIELLNKWTQNPTNSTLGYGGDKTIPSDDRAAAWKSLFNVHSTKLSSFLQKSSSIILTLLDEEYTTFSDNYKTKRRHNFFYSDGYYILTPLDFLSGAPVVNIYCSECSPYIITIYGSMTELPLANDVLNEKGIICVWNILDSKNPEYILTANSQPTCGTFGPGFSDVVIAGMVDGAVMLWDLTEINTNHLQMNQGISLTLRSPTYNTALILGQESHSSCIVGIQAATSHSKKDWRLSGFSTPDNNKNFHVMTLEDMGVINIWVVVEVLKPDISGMETDLGLAPGGKYRLVRSSSILLFDLATLQVGQKLNIRTFDFQLLPFDSSRILVTTDAGITLHVTRHSGTAEPRFYASEADFSCEIRCIDCSPHNEDLFLVGCSDGSVKLFNTKLVRPLMEFVHAAKGEPVNLLKWSVVHPAVFCVLSSSSYIHFWNIMEDSVQPLHSYHFEDCKVTWFAFKNMERNTNRTTSDKFSNFIIAKENGEVEVHIFQQKISEHEYLKQLEYMKNL